VARATQAEVVCEPQEVRVNRYDRYPGDYLRDTVALTLAQDGAYTRLLDAYYSSEAPIVDEEKFLLTRCRSKADEKITQWVLDRFFERSEIDGKTVWIHSKCEREIAKARKRIESSRTNGVKGGRPRNDSKPETQRVISGLTQAEPKPNPEQKLPSPSPSPSDQPDRLIDARQPFRISPDWDPGPDVLAGSAVPPWAHPECLARFRAYHRNQGTERTQSNWVQSYVRRAMAEWNGKNRPKRPELDAEQAENAEREKRLAHARQRQAELDARAEREGQEMIP